MVRLLRRVGVRAAVYTTHLHEMASDLDQLNGGTPGDSEVVSIVALATLEGAGATASPRFRIELRPPAGRSYAERIAARYGIALEQLTELLRARGALPRQDAAVE